MHAKTQAKILECLIPSAELVERLQAQGESYRSIAEATGINYSNFSKLKDGAELTEQRYRSLLQYALEKKVLSPAGAK